MALLFASLLLWRNEPARLRSLNPFHSHTYPQAIAITKPSFSLKQLPPPETGIATTSTVAACQSNHPSTLFLAPDQEVREVRFLDFDGDMIDEMAVLFTEEKVFDDSVTGQSSFVFITFVELFRCYVSGIETIYSFAWGAYYLMGCSVSTSVESLTFDDRQQLLLSASCGSGGYLNFLVLGYLPEGGIQAMFGEHTIPSGYVENINGQLIFGTCDSVLSVQWDGEKFAPIEYNSTPVISGTQIVHYWYKGGAIYTDLPDNTLTIERGQTIQLVRDHDQDDSSYPICYEHTAGLSYDNLQAWSRYVFTVVTGYQATIWLYPYENNVQVIAIKVVVTE